MRKLIAPGAWPRAPLGTTTAFMISMVGTGLGIYAGTRVADQYLT